MPIYEYQCSDCGGHFEIMAPRSRREERPTCTECAGRNTKRVMSSFSARSRTNSGSRRSGFQPDKRVGASACSTCAATSCAGCKR
jgi:putative FmdB family regulatory protein